MSKPVPSIPRYVIHRYDGVVANIPDFMRTHRDICFINKEPHALSYKAHTYSSLEDAYNKIHVGYYMVWTSLGSLFVYDSKQILESLGYTLEHSADIILDSLPAL